MGQKLATLGYFGLWFALNVYYNIVNKKVGRSSHTADLTRHKPYGDETHKALERREKGW